MRVLTDVNKQRSFTKLYWKAARKSLLESVQPVLRRSEIVFPEDLKRMTRSLLVAGPVENLTESIWLFTGSKFASETVRKFRNTKDEADTDFWERFYKRYAAERSAKITGQLLDTSAENINRIIDLHIRRGESAGLGIQDIANYMRANLEKDLITMQAYEAERIARTEVIGASNKGSFDGAVSTGLDIGKFWMTSGLPKIRDSHLYYESLGVVDMEYEYAPGLKHAGDANCNDPADIINCRCTIGYQDKE